MTYRKLLIAILFGSLCFAGFFITNRDSTCFAILVGALTGIAGWFNQANIIEHKNKNDEKNKVTTE